ncbi:MAG TPA: substrate-binding domain-containing protein [Nocardioidaceae bacterium]|nr:substrate-binding domain-containing protein [Nocardioidaceae bacterium]
MADLIRSGIDRRRFMFGTAAVGAAAVVTGCTSNTPQAEETTEETSSAAPAGQNSAPGKPVTIGFSAPAADHGWIAAITNNARSQAEKFEDVDLQVTEGTNDLALQISQVQTLINDKVDALVILPHDGNALTETARAAMDAGIPVINVDRVFASEFAYRSFIAGDNYGMGIAAGTYIGQRLKDDGASNPVIAEIAGIDSLPLTKARSQGFSDALKTFGFSVGPRQAAEFTVESGDEVTRNLLEGTPQIDAMWNHDDDQGIGVLAAIRDLGRDEFFMVGGAGSLNAMQEIKSGNSVLQATVTYPPTMSGSGINLARLVAQGRGMTDLVELEVPKSIIVASATVTADNVDQYMPLGFKS